MSAIREPLRLLDERSGVSEALRAALREEQATMEPTPAQLQALAAGVAPLLGAGAGAPAAAGAGAAAKGMAGGAGVLGKGLLLKVVVVAAVGGGAVGTWRAASRPPPPPTAPIARPVPSVAPAAAPAPLADEPEDAAPEPPRPPKVAKHRAEHSPQVLPAPVPGPPPLVAAPPNELELLGRARPLVASDPARALGVLEQHQTLYPHGTFEQEREVLAVDALMRLGRSGEAHRRAAEFQQRFPDSAHLRRVRVLLGEDAAP